MEKKSITVTPVALKEEIKLILDYVKSEQSGIDNSPIAAQLRAAIKKVEKNYIDTGSLIKISRFAVIYGKQKKSDNTPASKQAIYQLINAGRLPQVDVDGVKFVDGDILNE